MKYAIETKDLTKKFGRFHANEDVNIHVPEGSVYGLIGRNGAGKTTLMRMLLGLIKPTSGKISILGASGSKISDVLKQTGSIIETPTFCSDLTAFENLVLRGKLMGLSNPEQEAEKILKDINLYDKKDKKAKDYSLGMRQKLGIGAAIMGNPKLLILDEPINGLDPIAIAEVRKLLLQLNKQGTTILISSHILGEMEKVATCYGFVVDGRLVRELTEEDIKSKGIDLEKEFINMAGGE